MKTIIYSKSIKAFTLITFILCFVIKSQVFSYENQILLNKNHKNMETNKTVTVAPVLAWISLVSGLTSLGIAAATIPGKTPYVGNIDINVSESDFHVGDERTVTVTFDAGFGYIHDDDIGNLNIKVYLGNSFGENLHKNYTRAKLDGNNGRQFEFEFKIEGKDVGEEQIKIEISVTGDDGSWYWSDDRKTVSKPAYKNLIVLFPYSEPMLYPDSPLTLNHGQIVYQALKIDNKSTDPGAIELSKVNSSYNNWVHIPGAKEGTPKTMTLVEGAATTHDGPKHYGQNPAEFPTIWEVNKALIILDSPSVWKFPGWNGNPTNYCNDYYYRGSVETESGSSSTLSPPRKPVNTQKNLRKIPSTWEILFSMNCRPQNRIQSYFQALF